MKLSLSRLALLVGGLNMAAAVIAEPAVAAALTLEGVSVMGANSEGVGNGYAYGDNSTGLITTGGNQSVNTGYLAPGTPNASPAYLNTAAGPDLGFSLSTPGSYTFTLYNAGAIGAGYLVVNLFFGSDSAPGISAFAALSSTSFSPDSSGDLVPLTGTNPTTTVTGSGSLSYDNGSYTATLTALTIDPDYYNGQTLGYQTLNEPGNGSSSLETETFTLDVVPEPATLALLASGVAALGLLRRRQKPERA